MQYGCGARILVGHQLPELREEKLWCHHIKKDKSEASAQRESHHTTRLELTFAGVSCFGNEVNRF